MAMTFGYEYPPGREDDRFVKLAEDTAAGVTSLFLPESTIINIFPFLRHIPPWVPGATTQKLAADIRETFKGFKNEPFEFLKREVVRILSSLPGSRADFGETFRLLERRNRPCWQACCSVVEILTSSMMKYSRTHFRPITSVCHPYQRSPHPLTLDLAGVETVSSVEGFNSFLESVLFFVSRFSLLCRLRSFASRSTPPYRSARKRKLTESWEQSDYPHLRTGPLYLT